MIRTAFICLGFLVMGPEVHAWAEAFNVTGATSKLVFLNVAQTISPRDPYLQPFTSTSPWNYPVGSGAIYTAIPNIASYAGGLNYQQIWTTGIYKATTSDRVATLYIYKGDMWSQLANGTVKTTGNSSSVEDSLRSGSQATNLYPCNPYSTTVAGSKSVPPASMSNINAGWTNAIYVPTNATPSPDTDAHIAIMQPNGLFLEAYNTVVCANGDIISPIASFTDPTSDGTGYQNGRVASLFPNYGGKIRSGEISSGTIPHALCCTIPAAMLTEQIAWPAYAFDTNDHYTGTIPMGSLLAIPPTVNINSLGLSTQGKVIAHAAQDYGMYVMDTGGGGITVQAELGATDANFPTESTDLTTIVQHLMWISNNSLTNRGGGGTPRQPLAAPLQSELATDTPTMPPWALVVLAALLCLVAYGVNFRCLTDRG
jgi:hypothetical protein